MSSSLSNSLLTVLELSKTLDAKVDFHLKLLSTLNTQEDSKVKRHIHMLAKMENANSTFPELWPKLDMEAITLLLETKMNLLTDFTM